LISNQKDGNHQNDKNDTISLKIVSHHKIFVYGFSTRGLGLDCKNNIFQTIKYLSYLFCDSHHSRLFDSLVNERKIKRIDQTIDEVPVTFHPVASHSGHIRSHDIFNACFVD
jgi:hypothetical protein